MKINKTHKVFDGELRFCEHDSKKTGTTMNFSVFIPACDKKIDSAIVWLSGLTCSEENFMAKSGIASLLQDTNTMIICPDTSPRWTDLPGEHESYDFWSAAWFYVNATTQGYKNHYQMYDYVNEEIYWLLLDDFNIDTSKISIMWHSMWGHGALVIGLRNPDKYVSISAFAPIVNPIESPWWKKAFTWYLWDDSNAWKQYDASELIASGKKHKNTILIDQWADDDFLSEQLLTQNLVTVCKEHKQELEVNMRAWYDHSYYFIASFLKNHIDFHLKHHI